MSAYAMPERQWEKPKPAPHPEPEVPCRPADGEEIPRAARTIGRLAERHGWAVTPTYARGTRPGRPPRVADSVALRMRRDDVRAWSVWLDGRFDTAMISRPGEIPREVRLTAVREELRRPVGDAELGGAA